MKKQYNNIHTVSHLKFNMRLNDSIKCFCMPSTLIIWPVAFLFVMSAIGNYYKKMCQMRKWQSNNQIKQVIYFCRDSHCGSRITQRTLGVYRDNWHIKFQTSEAKTRRCCPLSGLTAALNVFNTMLNNISRGFMIEPTIALRKMKFIPVSQLFT